MASRIIQVTILVPLLLMATFLHARNESLVFPGIYTARYSEGKNEKDWLRRFDVLETICGEGDHRQQTVCNAQILVKSQVEYESIQTIHHALDYNSNLTQELVHPRMKVADSYAQQRKTQETIRDRDDFSNRNQYSTIRFYDCYYDYEGTMKWAQDFWRKHASPFSPLEVTLEDIGDSWIKTKGEGGYDIFVMTVTLKSETNPTTSLTATNTTVPTQRSIHPIDKAPLMLVTSTHAREYTPPILVRKWLEYIEQKVETKDPSYLSMLQQTKIHWIPYLNPDGRVLAETSQPWRRKNLDDEWTGNERDSAICSADDVGVDLNRNFPFEWGKSDGSSSAACSNFGRGAYPGSEPETQALVHYGYEVFPEQQRSFSAFNAGGRDYNRRHQPGTSIEGSSSNWPGYDPDTTRGVFIDVHSYGKVYIYPWGNMDALCPNDISFRSAMGHVESLTGLDAKGPGNNHYGVASGATDDWAYGVLGAFSMTWELGSRFHEPCNDFEAEYEKHLGAFEYLAQIAPFPYALGRGPIISDITSDHGSVTLHYVQEFEKDEFGIRNTTQAEFVRMESTSTHQPIETITFVVDLVLPDLLPSRQNPIDFNTDVDPHYEDEHHNLQSSHVTTLRIFFGGSHPLATAPTANSTFADAMEDYLEIDFSSFSNSICGRSSCGIPVTKDQLCKFFGDKASSKSSIIDHMLYFQAMDNLGNPGPVNTIPISIAFEIEEIVFEIDVEDEEVTDYEVADYDLEDELIYDDDDGWFGNSSNLSSSSAAPSIPYTFAPKLSLKPRWENDESLSEPVRKGVGDAPESALPLASAWALVPTNSGGVSTFLSLLVFLAPLLELL